LNKLEVSGPAVPVLENVAVGLGFAQLTWSPAGVLVYQRGGNDGRNVVARVKRDGATTIIDTAFAGEFNSLALSPDGRQLALGVGRQTGGLSIWVKQLDRGPFTRLSFSGQDRRPAWSPDGRRVAFVRDTAGSGYVAVVAVDGSGPARPLVRIPRQVQEVTWSRDGRWVLLRTDNTTPGAGDIVAVRADGSDTTEMPGAASEGFTELHPALSPSGRWLAYASNESGQNEIYVRPFPGPGGRWQVSNAGGVAPRWSADGREVYFLSFDGRIMAAQVREGPAFAVTGVQPLFEIGDLFFDSFHQAYDVGRDGSFYFLAPQRRSGVAEAPLVLANDWFADVRARTRQ
jgi:serine/threonine-protein kinase